jgi:Flp pilus assembly secretin CpaC
MTYPTSRSGRTIASVLAIAGSLIALPAWAADLQIEINQSRLHQLSRAASTVIVGHPSIADVSVTNADTLVVFGRSYGTTNLIALDATGRQIANFDVAVTPVQEAALTLTRGTGEYTYSCAPHCVRVINPTDVTEATDTLLSTTKEITGYGDQSAGGGS